MAGRFTSAAARMLIHQHEQQLAALLRVRDMTERARADVINGARDMRRRAALPIVAALPVEELNRERRGIRVAALRANGYETIGPLMGRTAAQLEAIRGVGTDSARQILESIDALIDEKAEGGALRLNADERTAEATGLLSSVRTYRSLKEYVTPYMSELEAYCSMALPALEALRAGTGLLRRLFAGSSVKQSAERAFEALSNDTNGYTAYNALRRVETANDGDVWQAFGKDPMSFIGVIEELCPTRTEETAKSILPLELVKQIDGEVLSTAELRCTLRNYQAWGVKYILHQRRVLLGDEMGLGKTIQAIATIAALIRTGETHFAVVCPASVLINWQREIERFSTLTPIVVYGASRQAELERWLTDGGVMLTTYETCKAIKLAESARFCLLVVDEAHYIKNPSAQRSAAVRALCAHAERLLFMTGTALENRVDEMLSLIEVLQPEIARKLRQGTAVNRPSAFRREIAPVYLRRRREEVLKELPELISTCEWSRMNETEKARYEEAVLSGNMMAARRVSWNVDDPEHSSKAIRLKELVSQAEEDGRRVIVFSFFISVLEQVRGMMGEKAFGPINGSITPERRQQIIDDFGKAPAGSVLIAQIQAGGTGLNIQTASMVILCEPQMKPGIEEQAIARAYRMGQSRNVAVHRLMCVGSIDERMHAMLEEKRRLFKEYADRSVAAEEGIVLDDNAMNDILQQEIERIKTERQAAAS